MVAAVSMLAGELLFEAGRFLVMILLLVVGVFVGGKLAMMKNAKKEAEKKEDSATE